VSQLVGQDPDTVSIGQKVEVVWDDVRPGVTVPRFVPSS
jgi:uncharacterized OB-fold protein